MIKYNPEKIKRLLKDKHINANKLAVLLNTDRQRVYAWLDGKQPQAEVLMNICVLLNLPMSYFFKEVK
jgi:transcriptional regulator with XRE-family HTH domain